MYSIFESELTVQSDYGSHHGDNYAKYFNMVAHVREEQLARFYNLPLEEIEARGYNLFISTAHINFIREPGEGEAVTVKTQIDNFSGCSCNVNFWVYKKSDKRLVADGYFVYNLRSGNAQITDEFPDDFLGKLSI